jgi:hypothetical protein
MDDRKLPKTATIAMDNYHVETIETMKAWAPNARGRSVTSRPASNGCCGNCLRAECAEYV